MRRKYASMLYQSCNFERGPQRSNVYPWSILVYMFVGHAALAMSIGM